MPITRTDLSVELEQLLRSSARELGVELKADVASLSLLASQRAAHLATLIGQPGFAEAVAAERDVLALRAGISAVRAADRMDQRILGILQTVLTIGARALL